MKLTSNYQKHTSSNPVQKFLISNFKKSLFSCLQNLDLEKVLDAGCGEGFILSELKNRGIGRHLEGVDCSSEALDVGKKIFPFLDLKQGDIYNLPYSDDSFDLVICTEVLEHLERPEDVLDEIIRISKKYCLLSVPNEPYFRMANFMRGKNISRWGNDRDHVQYWSSTEFENFIRSKMEIIAVMKPFPWTIVFARKT